MRTAQPGGQGTVTTIPPDSPVWSLEIECHGQPFKWTGVALSEGLATARAIADLSENRPDFNKYKARVTACVQVAS